MIALEQGSLSLHVVLRLGSVYVDGHLSSSYPTLVFQLNRWILSTAAMILRAGWTIGSRDWIFVARRSVHNFHGLLSDLLNDIIAAEILRLDWTVDSLL